MSGPVWAPLPAVVCQSALPLRKVPSNADRTDGESDGIELAAALAQRTGAVPHLLPRFSATHTLTRLPLGVFGRRAIQIPPLRARERAFQRTVMIASDEHAVARRDREWKSDLLRHQ